MYVEAFKLHILGECNAFWLATARFNYTLRVDGYALIAKLEVTVFPPGAKLCALSAKLEIAVWHRPLIIVIITEKSCALCC